MELRQLEYFIAVAEESNFTRAAKRVNVSQSGISAQIQQLEYDLGARLFDRSGRHTSLTTAGKAALEHARATIESADTLRQAVVDVKGLIRGKVIVGMVTACTVTSLFDLLGTFHTAHPGVEITLIEDSSQKLIDNVRGGTMDLALVGLAGIAPHGLHTITIAKERLVATVPFNHPLANRHSALVSDLSSYPIVCMPEGTGLRAVLDQACAAKGIRLDISLQATAPGTVADLATRGFGIAILSQSMATIYADRLKSITLSDVETPAMLALVWAENKNPALRELVRQSLLAFPNSDL